MSKRGGTRERRKRGFKHPESTEPPYIPGRPAFVPGPLRPLRQIWFVALTNRDPKRWVPRGTEPTRELAHERLRMLLVADFEGLYDGGWIKLGWAS